MQHADYRNHRRPFDMNGCHVKTGFHTLEHQSWTRLSLNGITIHLLPFSKGVFLFAFLLLTLLSAFAPLHSRSSQMIFDPSKTLCGMYHHMERSFSKKNEREKISASFIYLPSIMSSIIMLLIQTFQSHKERPTQIDLAGRRREKRKRLRRTNIQTKSLNISLDNSFALCIH